MSVHFEEGQLVNAGDVLLEIDPRPFQVMLEQAEGQQAKDQSLLANARIDLERYKTLLAQDSIAKQQYATQVATVNQAEAVLKSDQAAIDNAKLRAGTLAKSAGGTLGAVVSASEINKLAHATAGPPKRRRAAAAK